MTNGEALKAGLFVGGIVFVVGAVWIVKRKAVEAAEAVGDALNPTSDTNIAYRAASAIGNIGNKDDLPLGVRLYEFKEAVAGWFGYETKEAAALRGMKR